MAKSNKIIKLIYPPKKIISRVLLLIGTIVLGVQIIKLLPEISFFSDDFVTYWRAGWLSRAGLNPYSLELLHKVQIEQICADCQMLTYFWYPPWSVLFFIPFSWMPYTAARILWLGLSYIALAISGIWLWKLYGGSEQKLWLALLLSVSFSPAIFAVVEGAMAPFLLLGLAGFLCFVERNRPWSIGGFVLLLTVKPHLFYLFWLALALYVFQRKCWDIFWAIVATFLVGNLLVFFQSPDIFREFIEGLSLTPPHACSSATLSSVACLITGTSSNALQWLLPVAGIIWLLLFFWIKRISWNWKQDISIVLFISLITVPYAWMHDSALLILPVLIQTIQLLNHGRTKLIVHIGVAFQIINLSSLVLVLLFRYMQPLLFWVPWALLLLYSLVNKKINSESTMEI